MKIKWFSALAGLVGLAVAIALILHEGYGLILHLLATAGWTLLLLIPFHVLPLLPDVESWRMLLRPRDPERLASLPFLFWIATVREAVNRLLPVANVGGDLVGIRLTLLRPLPGAAVAASVIVEMLLTTVNLFLFTALGLILLVVLTHSSALSNALFIGLAVSLPAPVLFYLLLRHGAVFSRIERVLIGMLGAGHRFAEMLGGSVTLDRELRSLLAQPRRLAQSLLLQFAGLLLGSFETWLALRLLGQPISPWESVTLESLTQALRNFAFFVPAGIGVQEAGLVLFGNLIGLPADLSIALSLAKRLREIGFGVPALISWQWVEGRRLRRATRQATPVPPNSDRVT